MRKVYVDVVTRLIIQIDEGIKVGHILDDMDYNFSFDGEEADIIDTEIVDWVITDSK